MRGSMLKGLMAMFIGFISFSLSAQVVINEFMAANSSAVNDPDFDDSADWVELYNTSASAVDLTGYYLTDNLSDTTKWMFPAGTSIAGNGFLLIWADAVNIGIHTSFKLSSIGEEIGLYDAGLNLLDGFVYSVQETDLSYGRQNDGAEVWAWFSESTPGASNNVATPYGGITFYQPFFSQEGGFFDVQQSVAISALGGEIHYTLDGRIPTESDPIYTTPIVFDSNTFLRARIFVEGFIPGPPVTHSYFFEPTFEDRQLPVVSLVTDPDYFWDPEIGIYVQDFKPEWEHDLNIEFFENDGNNQSVFNQRAGVKVNGLWSWQLPQKMLGIYFRNEYGGDLDYPIFADRVRPSYDEFILRASGSDWANTLFRDGIGQDLVQENAPMYKQGIRPCIVFINGEYLGIHNMRSRSSDQEIEYMYGVVPNSFDIIANDGEIEEGSDVQYWYMDSLFNTDLSVEENFVALAEVVDLQNFADYWITEIWSSNSSWGHNVKLWKPNNEGKWQFIFGDLDRGFSGSTNDPISGFSVPQGGNNYDYARYWLQHMFENQEFSKYFAQRFSDHVYTSFHPIRVNSKIDEFKNRLDPEIAYHVEKWTGTTSNYGDGIVTVQFWEDQVAALRQFAEERQGFIMEDLQSTFGLSTISNLGAGSFPTQGGKIRLNNFMIPELPWSGPYFDNMPLTMTAVPNPGYDFFGWSIYDQLALVDLGQQWRYHDLGEDLGTSWTATSFDDSSWGSGNAELGYGDGDEATTVSFGPDGGNKYITTYFRKSFVFDGTEDIYSCALNLRRDDGAVVYLNGLEVVRSNMPAGNITATTPAAGVVGGDAESNLIEYIFQAPLSNGANVLAVEVHQISGTSSDISFDLNLSIVTPIPEIISTQLNLPVTLNGSTGYLARYVPNGACILPAEIAENTTLTIDCSPYLASGDTYVLSDVTLIVDPGVEIWFPEEARLIVQGGLQVNGTESQGVIFRNNADYGAQSWGNLSFDSSTEVNNLNYLELINATKGVHPIHERAAISCWFSEVNMDHMTLLNNLNNPIFGEYSDISLTSSVLHSPVSGDLINIKYGDGYISDCQFIGNDQVDTDAIDYDEVINGVIRNSSIEGFYGFNSDGIDLGEGCENILIENCLINDCTDKGVSIGQSSSALIQNNTIANCNLGIGIKDLGEAEVDHTTFYSNAIAIAAFEKNPGFGGGTISVSNSILSNSSTTPWSVDEMSFGIPENNFYNTDTMPGTSNLWMDPLFESPSFYDFQLQVESPALNAGLDGENLGTLDHSFVALPKVMISDIQYFHPENADQEFIKLVNPGTETLDLSGYAVSVGIIFSFPEGTTLEPDEKIMLVRDINLFPSETGQVYEWTSGQLENQGELLLLTDNHGIVVDHVSYLPLEPWPLTDDADEYISLSSVSLDNHFASSWQLENEYVGLEENHTASFNVYPNPAKDHISFASSVTIDSYRIYDALGRKRLEGRPEAKMVSLSTEILEPGFYLVTINGSSNMRFVKQ